MMADLVNGLHIKLQTYKRGDDETHFNNYTSLYGLDRRAKDVRRRALHRMQQHYIWDGQPPTLCFCVAHKKRMAVNRYLNKLHAPAEGFIEIKKPEEDAEDKGLEPTMAPQDMLIWAGLELIGCPSVSDNVLNGVTYRIVEIDEDEETVKVEMCAEYRLGTPPDKQA